MKRPPPEGMTPEQICRAAFKAVGVPSHIFETLKPGRRMDLWVEFCVMDEPQKHWMEVKRLMDAAEKLGDIKV